MPDIANEILRCLDRCQPATSPFRHWPLTHILPDDACAAIDALPHAPTISGDTLGKRETNNSLRMFFGTEARSAFPVCDAITHALQSPAVTGRLSDLCGVTLAGHYLRIEYCLDTDGFWLEPHTDIGAKRFTMLVYLSDTPGSEAWGTDLLDTDLNLVATTPYRRDDGFIFIPAADSWHGFHKRRIDGVRRSLIVNYVVPEWRSRHELAFPDEAVGSAPSA